MEWVKQPRKWVWARLPHSKTFTLFSFTIYVCISNVCCIVLFRWFLRYRYQFFCLILSFWCSSVFARGTFRQRQRLDLLRKDFFPSNRLFLIHFAVLLTLPQKSTQFSGFSNVFFFRRFVSVGTVPNCWCFSSIVAVTRTFTVCICSWNNN